MKKTTLAQRPFAAGAAVVRTLEGPFHYTKARRFDHYI
jgi:hypothetical protein